MSFYAQLIYLIAWILKMPSTLIEDSTNLREDLDLDVMDFDLMIFQLESYYKTEFTTEEIAQINTVHDIEKLLRRT